MILFKDLCQTIIMDPVYYTSVDAGHVYQCLDVTSPPVMSKDDNHVHYTEGYVVYEDGHTHYCQAILRPCFGKMYVHYYDF
ncbi:UNVERIFIED_ORG: hypothetical protein ABIC97_003764 [Peribacillus simplex]